MMKAVADTHTAIWYLWSPEHLSRAAAAAIDQAYANGDRILLSSITLCEVIYLAEKGRIREDAFDLVVEGISSPDGIFEEAPFDAMIASAVRRIPRSQVPDMPDRIIAATALQRGIPVITKDRRIHGASVPCIW